MLFEQCKHDLENAKWVSRATWICPKCEVDISLEYVMYRECIDEPQDEEIDEQN